MARYKITSSDGRTAVVTGERPPTEEDINAIFSSGNLPFTEMMGEAATNIPSSLYNLGADTLKAISSPIQTAKTVLDLGIGVVGILAEGAASAVGLEPTQVSPMADKTEMARKVGRYFMNKYGSLESAKQAFASDPASVLADASTILGVGGVTLPGKAGIISTAVAGTIDPLAATAKTVGAATRGIGRGAAEVLGKTTGAGGQSFRTAYEAGFSGGADAQQLTANMRGNVPQEQVLDIAKSNLDQIRATRNADYRSGMVDITNDKSILDFADVDTAIKSAINRVSFKGMTKDQTAANALNDVNEIIQSWRNLPPDQYHTPEGFDAMKQSIGAVIEKLPFEQKNARAVAQSIYDATRSTIKKQTPTYSRVMSDYEGMSNLIKEIERTLSLGGKAAADTSMRKLQSLMRNNVSTNYGQRSRLGSTLEQMGGEPIMPSLAGQALSEFAPRGIQGGVSGLAGLGAYSLGGIPAAVGSAAISSPRLMGEATALTGKIAGKASRLVDKVPAQAFDPRLYNALYQTQQTRGNR